jgi:hypothetical protein
MVLYHTDFLTTGVQLSDVVQTRFLETQKTSFTRNQKTKIQKQLLKVPNLLTIITQKASQAIKTLLKTPIIAV